jgi:hypothetical protein
MPNIALHLQMTADRANLCCFIIDGFENKLYDVSLSIAKGPATAGENEILRFAQNDGLDDF